MEVRHHAGPVRTKDWKLLCDPTINPAYSTKVFRCDGPTSGRSPDRPRDPRTPRMHSWTSRRESANLPLPKFVYDEYYVGDPIEKEVTFDNLNDNITQKNLLDMCKPFGVVEDPKVYFHPRTKKHLGIGKVVFRSSRAANECAQKLNNTSKMGNIMVVKVDPMGKERHALIQARIGSSRRHGEGSQHGPPASRPGENFTGASGHASGPGSSAQFHASIPPSHPLHPRSQEFAQRPSQPPQPQPHAAYPPPHGGHDASGGFIEEVVSRSHHEPGHHGPPPSSHHHRSSHHHHHSHPHPPHPWPAPKNEHGGRRRRDSDQRSPEQSLLPPPAPDHPVVVNHSTPMPMDANLSSAANSSAEGGVLETSDSLAAAPSRRDSSISNESGATGTSAGLLQDSLVGLAGGSGGAVASNDEESLESRIQKLLKGTSLSGPTPLNALAPSPIAGAPSSGRNSSGFLGLPPPGALPNATGTPLSDEEAMMRSVDSRGSGSPQQPNTPPSPPSPGQLDAMAMAGVAGRTLLAPPGGMAPHLQPSNLQHQLASRRTLLPTPPGGLLPTPAGGLPELPPPSVLPSVTAPPAAAAWPEACSDAVLTEVLKLLVDELKEVMKRDVSKRMTESCAFPVFNRWWAGQEKRAGGGGLYPSQSALSPSKRLDGHLSRKNILSPGASKFSRLDPFPHVPSLPSTASSTSSCAPPSAAAGAASAAGTNGASGAPPPSSGTATESEVNLGGGQNATVASESGGGGSGAQQTTSGFAALFESLKEGGGGMSFFKGIRGALPKIKRKPRAPTPPREKSSAAEKNEASRRNDVATASGANAKNESSPKKENGPLQRPGSPPSSTDERRRKSDPLDGGDSDSTSPAVASSDDEPMDEDGEREEEEEEEDEEDEEDSSGGSSASSSSEDEDEEEEEEEEGMASSSDLSEADAARQRELLERQQARLIRQLDKLEGRSSNATGTKQSRGRPSKAPAPASPSKSAKNKLRPSAKNEEDAASVSSISTLSSSANESVERAPPVPKNKKKTPLKKTPEKKRENNSLFDVFNTLLEGKQKTSTTLATPQTLNRRIVDEKEADEEERESERSSEEEEDEMEEEDEKESDEELRRPVAPPRSRARLPPPKRPVARKVERSLSASSSSGVDSEEEEEEDEDEEGEESESGSSDDEGSLAGDSQWSDRALEPSPSRRRRKQDLFSPATTETPPLQKTPSTPGGGPATMTTASQRLRQMKKGEALPPLPPPFNASSAADSGEDDGSEAEEEDEEEEEEEDLSWLPDVGESYEWPWSVQHDHSYCFEPNAEAMQLRPLNDLAEQLLEMHQRRTAQRKRPATTAAAGPPKKRSMQDITNKHRDRTARGSRELASLFTPVEAKSLAKDRHRKKLAPQRQRQRFKARDMVAEQDILFDIFVRGIDEEDVKFLHLCYQRLLDEDNTGTSWVNDTHWVEHPVTYTPEASPQPERQDRGHSRARARQLRACPAPAHSSGSLRTEGFYRLTRAEKCSLALSAAAGAHPRGGDFPTNMSAANSAAAVGITDENASKKAKVREMRSEQRRLLAEFQDVETGDLLKFNQLKFRKKQLQFDRSGIHSWGLFAWETIAAEEMVIEYVGQMIRKNVAEVREKKYEASGIGSSYLFRVDDEFVIDATMCGNFARFINHSCNPNCYAKVITVESAKKIVIYSKREILKYEEITYDYKFPYEEEKIQCLCGSASCRGTLN